MHTSKPFYDLCISDKVVEINKFEKMAKRLLEYGYHTVAISRFLDEDSIETRKGQKKKKGDPKVEIDFVPEPVTIPNLPGFEKLKVLQRLTLIFSDSATVHKVVKSPNFKKYDIFAVIPKNQKAMQCACTEIDADILSFDPEIRTPIKFSRKLYNCAIDRGMCFEIMYSPAICDSTLRKNILVMSHLYHAYGKSRNIIFSSWATDPILIRGPYDLTILGTLFGLNEEQAKNAISSNCQKLIIRAEGRKLGKVVTIVKNIEEQPSLMIISDSAEESDMELRFEDEPEQPALKKSKPEDA